MKLVKGLIVTEVGGEYLAVATGDAAVKYNGLIKLNGATAYLMEIMQEEFTTELLVSKLTEKYDVEQAQAEQDVNQFVEQFKKYHLLEGV